MMIIIIIVLNNTGDNNKVILKIALSYFSRFSNTGYFIHF